MELTPSARNADARREADVVLPPDHVARAADALSRLVREAARDAADRRPGASGVFDEAPRAAFADPRMSEPRMTAPKIEIEVEPRDDGRFAGGLGPADGGARRGLVRIALAAAIGIAATLAWQSFGGAAREMAAAYVPALAAPGGGPVATPPGATSAQQAAPATPGAAAPAVGELAQEIQAIARELAVLRQSVDQLGGGQKDMARTIARLQAAEAEVQARLAALAAPAPARKPVTRPPQPAPQVVAPGPRPLSQSFTPSPGPPPPQPRPQPLRPPAGLP